jgi:hypothetical protein
MVNMEQLLLDEQREEFQLLFPTKDIPFFSYETGEYKNSEYQKLWAAFLVIDKSKRDSMKDVLSKLNVAKDDYLSVANKYQTLLIDLAPTLTPSQIKMIGDRTGSWFVSFEDGTYIVRHDPRDTKEGLWENIKPRD